MRYYAADYRQYARNALAGNWGTALAVALVAGLLGVNGYSSSFSYSTDWDTFQYYWDQYEPIFTTALAIAAVLSLVYLIIGGAVRLGLCLYNIKLIRGERPQFSVLFSRFDIFGKALGLNLMTALLVFLWSLLFIVPGIVAAYRYAMAPYLLAEYPEMGVMEAIERSKQMMMGCKGRLFCLEFSFFGWILLCMLSLGIGSLWLNPYMCAAEAAFYYERMYAFPYPPQSGYPGIYGPQPGVYYYGQPYGAPYQQPPAGTSPYEPYPPQGGQPGASVPPQNPAPEPESPADKQTPPFE